MPMCRCITCCGRELLQKLILKIRDHFDRALLEIKMQNIYAFITFLSIVTLEEKAILKWGKNIAISIREEYIKVFKVNIAPE